MNSFDRKIESIKSKFTNGQQREIRLESVEQFYAILKTIEDDNSRIERHKEHLDRYLDAYLLVDSNTLNKEFIESSRAKHYYPVLHYLEKKKYYTGGWIGLNLLIGIPLDLIIYFTGILGSSFIPLVTVSFFLYKQIDYLIKKKRDKVLIEDR